MKAARAAYEGAWGKLTAAERGRLIAKLGLKVLDHFDELAKIEAQDTGKPMAQARADIDANRPLFRVLWRRRPTRCTATSSRS